MASPGSREDPSLTQECANLADLGTYNAWYCNLCVKVTKRGIYLAKHILVEVSKVNMVNEMHSKSSKSLEKVVQTMKDVKWHKTCEELLEKS